MAGVYKKHDLAWTAGIIDGEGSVMLTPQHKGQRTVPTVSVTSTTKQILEKLRELFGGNIRSQRVYKDHHKPSWIWSVSFNRALFMLKQIQPYMVEPLKIERSKLLTSEYKACTPRNGKYTSAMSRRRDALDQKFSFLS